MRDFLIKNLTQSTIEVSKATVDTISVFAGSTLKFRMTLISWWHGHSDIGSFIISKQYDAINFKCWGNLKLNLIQDNDTTIFEIVEKNSSE